MTFEEFDQGPLAQALAWLPEKYRSIQARGQILKTGLQESKFIYRRQMGNGPARSFFQMEKPSSVTDILTRPATADLAHGACSWRGIQPTPDSVWNAIEFDDVLAAVWCRLNYWNARGPLPEVGDQQGSWDYYNNTWRPGKPKPESWADYHRDVAAYLLQAA